MGVFLIKIFALKILSVGKGGSGMWSPGPDTDKVDMFAFMTTSEAMLYTQLIVVETRSI